MKNRKRYYKKVQAEIVKITLELKKDLVTQIIVIKKEALLVIVIIKCLTLKMY